jgi:sugar/nucleoside kinase (ribokinase family)
MIAEAAGEREIERIDIVNRTPTPAHLEVELLARLERLLPQVDAVILLDQVNEPDRGVHTTKVRSAICKLASDYPEVVFYADSRKQIDRFENVIIKVNHREALRATGRPEVEEPIPDQLKEPGRILMERTQRPVVITMGPKGMLLTEPAGQTVVAGIPVSGPIDIVGAGDSATAGMVLSLCCDASLPQAALVGNLVASITIQQLGTTGTASPDQVLARYKAFASGE